MTIVLAVLYIGLVAAVCSLLATAMSFCHPAFEIANDFLLFEIIGAGFLLSIALVACDSFFIAATSAIFVFLLMRLQPSLLTAVQRRPAQSPFLRIVSFNINQANRRFESIAKFISASVADLVVLQEIDRTAVREISRKLGAASYHVVHDDSCMVALFAKDAHESSGFIAGTDIQPDLVWARFQRSGIAYKAFGVYFADPFHPRRQERQLIWLTNYLRERSDALIVAGDFNMTPFSPRLNKFARVTGLRRHSTFLRSWPARAFPSAFLIDHLFSTQEFVAVRTSTGPSLGSDHYAIIADIGLTKPHPIGGA